MRGAGGSRTRFRGFADRRPAVRLRRPRNVDPLPLSQEAMSSPGIEPGLRPSQSRVRIRHTPRTMKTSVLPSPPPGNRTRTCGFEDRRASATPAGKQSNALARSRTWSSTFGGSRAVRHTPRAQSKPTAGLEPASTCLQGRCLTVRPRRRRAGAQGFEPCPRVLEARCSPRSTPL
jgi:hypothetical protein